MICSTSTNCHSPSSTEIYMVQTHIDIYLKKKILVRVSNYLLPMLDENDEPNIRARQHTRHKIGHHEHSTRLASRHQLSFCALANLPPIKKSTKPKIYLLVIRLLLLFFLSILLIIVVVSSESSSSESSSDDEYAKIFRCSIRVGAIGKPNRPSNELRRDISLESKLSPENAIGW